MARLVILILLICSILILPIYGKTTNSLLSDLNLIEQELLNSRIHSRNLSEKIINLKTYLSEALKLPVEQKKRIELLQNQLIELSKSLADSKQNIKENEKKYEAAVKEIRAAHIKDMLQARVKGWYKFGAGILIGIGVVAVIILVK